MKNIGGPPHPQYDTWNRIKDATRYLEVLQYLKVQVEMLEESINGCRNIRKDVSSEIQSV